MGAGKSTVARLLARRMVWSFLDLDAVIVRHMGMSVSDIFSVHGEEGFRAAESHALRQTVLKPATVVALGGGSWERAGNRELSRARAVSVWLDCPLDLLRGRVSEAEIDTRPLWRDPGAVEALFLARKEGYAEADLRVDATAPPERVADAVLERLESLTPQ